MGYQDGVAEAESKLTRFDWFGRKKAKCDPRYGWKQGPGGKCIRVSPEENPEESFGTDVFLTEGDKDIIEGQFDGGVFIDSYVKQSNTSRKNAVLYARDAGRLMSQGADGVDFNSEVGEMNRFAEARERGDRSVKNKYGTNQFVSSAESVWIDNMGGPDTIKVSKSKAIDYMKDAYMTLPIYSKDPNSELAKLNKHYFGK